MKLNEAEMRMAYQIESTDPNAVLNEIYMTWRLSRNQATRDTAESLMAKLRSLSNKECMDLIREVQANYRLPGKPQTIGEMLAEARQKSGAQKLAGHDIMALERFDPDTRHMIVFDVLSNDSPMGWKGEKMRLFLTEAGYGKALENQEKGFIRIRNHAKVRRGDLLFEKAVKKFLEEIQKSRQPKIYRGKQTLRQLASQNAGLANIEISDKNIKAFTHVAKKYHVDFALKKDTAAEQPRYLVFFKSRDADAITAAFQEFAGRRMGREEKPAIRDRLEQAKEQAERKPEHRTLDREKVKTRDRSVQR